MILKINKVEKRIHRNILSLRETDVLAMIVEGAKDEEIAESLCISKYTVKTHLQHIFKKTNANCRFQAALWGAKNL